MHKYVNIADILIHFRKIERFFSFLYKSKNTFQKMLSEIGFCDIAIMKRFHHEAMATTKISKDYSQKGGGGCFVRFFWPLSMSGKYIKVPKRNSVVKRRKLKIPASAVLNLRPAGHMWPGERLYAARYLIINRYL